MGKSVFEGRESGTDKVSRWPPARRTDINIVSVHPVVLKNHRLTVKSIEEQANVDTKKKVKKMYMNQMYAKW